jgi:hypothetical protein
MLKKACLGMRSRQAPYHDCSLCERILGWVEVTLREVVVDLVNGDTHVLENLPEILTLMAEHNGAVVWVVLLDEDVTIEAAHVLDTEDTDRTE